MVGELRWILLGLSALLLLGILWWGARRSRQSPGDAQLRESSAPAYIPPEPAPTVGDAQRWGVSPLEPLSIRTADFEPVSMADMSMTATGDPVEVQELKPAPATGPVAPSNASPPPPMAPAATVTPRTEEAPSPVTPSTSAPTASEAQRIVTIRVSAAGDGRWGGAEVAAALEKHGLQYGRYKVFHRKHDDGRTLFCAASLVEPGTFDLTKMPEQEFRGLTLFAVLPGPIDAVETVDMFILTADAIARTLAGVVQDSQGAPLTAESIIRMREDAARFQTSLAMR